MRSSQQQVWGIERPRHIVVDSGTGATAVGLALGAALAGAPWTVHGVMLASNQHYYETQQHTLSAAFCSLFLPGEGVLVALPPVHFTAQLQPWPLTAWPCALHFACRSQSQSLCLLLADDNSPAMTTDRSHSGASLVFL